VYGVWDLSFKEIKKRTSGQSSGGNAQAAKAAILILGICTEDIFQFAAEKSGENIVNSEMTEKLQLFIGLLALYNGSHWDEFIYRQGISVLLSF
jgi:hypothetical protein